MASDAAAFELFDHTADLGLRVRAATRADLVAPATAALYAAIGELVPTDAPPAPARFDLRDTDDAVLLRDYLAELLRLFESEHAYVENVRVERFEAGQLSIVGDRRGIDPAASDWAREVKAVTYHELALREVDGGWEFVCIVDI